MIIKIDTGIQVHIHVALVARYEQPEFLYSFCLPRPFQHTFTMGKRHENKYY